MTTNREKLNNVTHTVRCAQAVLQYGVGAMIDFPDQTLMTASPEFWNDQIDVIHDERLEKALGVQYFGMPGGKANHSLGISYVRFPQWYFCPQCRRFMPILDWIKEYRTKRKKVPGDYDYNMKKPYCTECKKDLVATRVVVACEKGHIDDFPWVAWVHNKNLSGSKDICSNPQLTFGTSPTASAGLEGLLIKCTNCNARASMQGAFDKDIFEKMGDAYKCTGNMPWKNEHTMCDEFPIARQRGASSVYYPKIASSLVIPPYSNRVNLDIEKSKSYHECLIKMEEDDDTERKERIKKQIDNWSDKIAIEISANPLTVKNILLRKWGIIQQENYATDSSDYRYEEFQALTGQIPKHDLLTGDFITEDMDVNQYHIPGIERVTLVHKVREVRALTGFTRINPPGASDLGKDTFGFVSSKEPDTSWFPAYEVRGEGIFLEFDKSQLERWVSSCPEVLVRSKIIEDNYKKSFYGGIIAKDLSPQFIFLHTLAHLLIRELSFECGYSAASLRERIYFNSYKTPMAGILVYTAGGDSEGTLGGLVRQGYHDCLPHIFRKAIANAKICANDPVCITSNGQGRDSLNLGACHSCVLLPETSCDEYNSFLDRALVIGTFENKMIGFYSNYENDIV